MFRVVHEPESNDPASADPSGTSGKSGDYLGLIDDAGRTVGACRLWSRDTTTLDGKRCGYIGSFNANDAGVFSALAKHATDYLERKGCHIAVAPIDGDTWHAYRWVTSSDGRPAFFLEPANSADWPRWISEAGFEPISEYFSAVVDDLLHREQRLARVEKRLEQRGMHIRPLNLDAFTDELVALHALSLDAFQHNFLYTPISRNAFVSMYAPLRDRLRANLCLLAECDDDLVGFVFGVPDFAQAQRGEPVDTVIVKTLAVRPGRDWAGLGNLLMERCHLAAHDVGFKCAIHALMHESNKSMSLSARYGKPFRRYALYARSLCP